MVVMACTSADAANQIGIFTDDCIGYYLYDDGTAKVGGYAFPTPAKITIPQYIVYDNDAFTVTSIDQSAFINCTSLRSIEMNSVSSISSRAFAGCTSLESVEMNSAASIGEDVFKSCTSLQSIEINSVTSIGNRAFEGCTSLESVEMNGVTSISEDLFKGCTSLQSIEMNSVTSIGKSAFSGFASLESVEMNSVTSIGQDAFKGCTSLQSIEMNSITNVEAAMFSDCTSLKSVTMNSVTTIGNKAFSGHKSLESVEMRNVRSIGNQAFYGCYSLKSLDMNSVTSIGQEAFSGCSSLRSVNLTKITSVENGTFSGCSSLESVAMNSATSIGQKAFSGCSSLKSVEMNSATSIGQEAFSGCCSLESVEMNIVTSIGQEAFSGCSSLKSITLLNANPPTCGKNAFPVSGNFTFFVPRDSKVKYKSTTWGKTFIFKSIGADKRIVVTTTAGQLMEKIDIDNISQIWDIKISGEINGTDLNIINRMENLENLDLSDCRIVSGGASYYRYKSKDYYTRDDALDSYAIRLATLDSISYPRVKSIGLDAVSITPRLYYAVIPETVTNISCEMPCFNYTFEYGDEILAGGVYGAKKVWLGRLVDSNKFFDDVKSDIIVASTLEEVVIAYPYTEFKSSLFSHCSKLTSFKIPASIQNIGTYVFWCCYGLTDVICCAHTPPSANANSFDESTYEKATLYVPVGTRNAYFFDPVWGGKGAAV